MTRSIYLDLRLLGGWKKSKHIPLISGLFMVIYLGRIRKKNQIKEIQGLWIRKFWDAPQDATLGNWDAIVQTKMWRKTETSGVAPNRSPL